MIHGTRGTGHRWQQRNWVAILKALEQAGCNVTAGYAGMPAANQLSRTTVPISKWDVGDHLRGRIEKVEGEVGPPSRTRSRRGRIGNSSALRPVGMPPGGEDMLAFFGCAPCEFGKGAIEGVAGPVGAQTSFIAMPTLGLP